MRSLPELDFIILIERPALHAFSYRTLHSKPKFPLHLHPPDFPIPSPPHSTHPSVTPTPLPHAPPHSSFHKHLLTNTRFSVRS